MDYLINNYSVENISFSKPKKHKDHYICKVKYSSTDPDFNGLVIQFPRMKLNNDLYSGIKTVELEFLKNKSPYNKKTYDFLSKLDEEILSTVEKNTKEWFEKEIPLDRIKKMYNGFIKPPKDSDSNCTLNFNIDLKKNCTLMDNKNETLVPEDFRVGLNVDCIGVFKYIVFSKDSCFPVWELDSLKINKRVKRVPKFGFIEDSDTNDFTIDEEYSFF
jgi:hypothetical protein